MITLSTTLALGPHIRFRRFEDEGIIIDQKSAEAVVISDVATRLIELSREGRSLAECAALLAGEFDAEQAQIEADLLHFAGELTEAGIVIPS
jgi:hypothetical protein